MDKLDRLRVFVEVVDAGGFAAASRRLGLSRSAVSRAIIQLENELGAQLLTRSTRKVMTTSTGIAFYDRCSAILHDLDSAMASVTDGNRNPTGNLRVNAPMSFGTLHLTKLVSEYMARYPDVHVELILNDRQVDPIEEGFDVTVRIGMPPQSTSLIVQQIATAERVLCAAPSYIAEAGEPRSPSELVEHRCLHYGHMQTGNAWPLTQPDGSERAYPIGCVMWSNNGQVLADAARHGQGIALLPAFLTGTALKEGTLVPVLSDYAPSNIEIFSMHPRHRHLSGKVIDFVDTLSERLGGRASWDSAG